MLDNLDFHFATRQAGDLQVAVEAEADSPIRADEPFSADGAARKGLKNFDDEHVAHRDPPGLGRLGLGRLDEVIKGTKGRKKTGGWFDGHL